MQQITLQNKLKRGASIAKDVGRLNRGWYICGEDFLYLHHDGIVRNGCQEDISPAFWPDKESAAAFYRQWRKEGVKITKGEYN